MMLTVQEAAKLLRRDISTVTKYVQAGRLSGRKIDGRWMIDPESVERLILSPVQHGKTPAPAHPWRSFRLPGSPSFGARTND